MSGNSVVLLVVFAALSPLGPQELQTAPTNQPLFEAASSLAAIDSEWKQCLDGNTTASDRYVMDCHFEARERLVGLMDGIVAARRSGLTKSERWKLDRDQAHWSKRAVRKCESDPWFRFNGGLTKYPGTAAFVDYGFCIIRATQKRIATLLDQTR